VTEVIQISVLKSVKSKLASATNAAYDTEGLLMDELSDRENALVLLTDTLADHKAKASMLAGDCSTLRFKCSEKAATVETLQALAVAAENVVTGLHAQLSDGRHHREDDVATIVASTKSLRTIHADTVASTSSAKDELKDAEVRKHAELASATASLDHIKANNATAIAALNKQLRKQTKHLAYLDDKHRALQEERDSVDAKCQDLEAQFADEAPGWAAMQAELTELEAERKRNMEEYLAKLADAEESQQAAEERAKQAKDVAEAAVKRCEAASKELEGMRQDHQVELDRLRAENSSLGTVHISLRGDNESLKGANGALQDRLAGLPSAQEAELEALAAHVEAIEAERDAKSSTCAVSAGIRQRASELENVKNIGDIVAATVEGLDRMLCEAHAKLYAEKKRLKNAEGAQDVPERKAKTYGALLATLTPFVGSRVVDCANHCL
jgi:chromosome segregation ATPase